MTQLPEPTLLEWAGFAITMACLAYGVAVIVLDRLPEWMRATLQRLLFRTVPGLAIEALRLASWAFAWFGAGLIWLLSAGRVPVVDELLRRGRAAPVSDVTPPSAVDYVAPPDLDDALGATDLAVAPAVAGPLRPIAITDTPRNEPLTRNVVTRAQADIISRLLRAKTLYTPDGRGGFKPIGQTALIRLATGLEPNGRADSEYGELRAALDDLAPAITVREPDGRIRQLAAEADPV